MKNKLIFSTILIILIIPYCRPKQKVDKPAPMGDPFPKEMVEFVAYDKNPVFKGTGQDTWDRTIRERGFILNDNGTYKLWYTGYNGSDTVTKYLGYATSPDGINWTRHEKNPVFSEKWTEDMFVFIEDNKYIMYAEGRNDVAHILVSVDGIKWQEQGDIKILTTKGDTIPGPYGTPAVWRENNLWYLFYERNDEAIWLAVSNNQKTWVNFQDEPVLKRGPEDYDSGAVAANQIIKFKGRYYMFYHGTSDASWADPGASSLWTSNVAMSEDLYHWTKFPGNPIVEGDHSSPILVPDGDKFRLYTMHPEVWLWFPK
ncbi:MAG: glycosylase [Bacteroidales bacterium]|nr:glycosylase [Bacteroidales bacterium]